MKKAFITGISGFAGSYLSRLLLQKGDYVVSGTYHSENSLQGINDITDKLTLIQVDLTKSDQIDHAIATVDADIIFHLAALASPSQSFKDPSFTFSTNIIGQINLLEAIKKHSHMPSKILIISSAEVYGKVAPSDLPIDEETQMRPVSPYAVSKIAQDYLGLQYFMTYNMPIIRTRPFNHIGPRQKPAYAVAAFASQIAKIEKGQQEPVLKVGNLSARRDFTDVRDIVQAYVALVEKGDEGDVYNVGSGTSQKMSDILERLVALSTSKISIIKDASRLMPIDIADNRSDITKVTQKTGWKPAISLDTSLRDVLDYWRNIP
ncbi:MAG: GDP-mannose 4,6-dehydratase [bacterium]|nr:GDP-mannose 4,6-dehydratase [bacterium]